MPTVNDVRAAIKAKLDGIAGIGMVNDYERYADMAAALKALYVDAGAQRLSGCFFAHRATARRSPGLGRYAVTHRWELRFFRSLEDAEATEKALDSLLEQVALAFQADENLGGTISSTVMEDGVAGLQLEEKNHVIFCGVLCHAARARLSTRHYE